MALCGGRDDSGPVRCADRLSGPVGTVSDGGQAGHSGQRSVNGEYAQLQLHGYHHSGGVLRRGRRYRRGRVAAGHSEILTGIGRSRYEAAEETEDYDVGTGGLFGVFNAVAHSGQHFDPVSGGAR